MDFREALVKINHAAPYLPVTDMIKLADAFSVTAWDLDLTTHESRVAFARNNPTIISLIETHAGKAPAVSALRKASLGHKVNGATMMTLREAVDAVNEIGNL